jgi:hypothetical protein
MDIENDKIAPLKANDEEKTADAFRQDLFETTGSHHGYQPYYPWNQPVFTPPTSRVNAFQYQVHDGNITILGR